MRKVLALSTDKAVNPVNLYGATKLCAEKLLIQGNSYAGGTHTRLSCTRYGNVLGSRGSIIPVFRQQRDSGRVTVTDARMTRFWLTLEQGVRFVLGCIEEMHGGEVFVPRIPSMKIIDLAAAVAPECEVDFIGIRPGEKLHEVMLSRDEARHSLRVDGKYVILPEYPWWSNDHWEPGHAPGRRLRVYQRPERPLDHRGRPAADGGRVLLRTGGRISSVGQVANLPLDSGFCAEQAGWQPAPRRRRCRSFSSQLSVANGVAP